MRAPEESFLRNLNPSIPDPDFLYHLGLGSDANGLKEMFEDVRQVVMMGSGPRAFRFAKALGEAVNGEMRTLSPEPARDFDLMAAMDEQFEEVMAGRKDLLDVMSHVQDWVAHEAGLPRTIGKEERYWMYKVDTPAGGVISVNHHMGMPTHSILLHEVTKLLHHVGADRVERPFEYARLGTSGGLGIEGGDIVVARRGLDPSGQARYRLFSLGEEYEFPTEFDPALRERVMACREAVSARVLEGDTVACNDFYIEQGRLDGAFNMAGSEAAKIAYLQRLHGMGARNMEMESAGFAAFTQHMGIPSTCIATALLNRLHGDQVKATGAELAAYSDGPQQLYIEYLKRQGK